jgi:hypothetical protein
LVGDDADTEGPGGVLVESNVNYLKDNGYMSTAVPVAITAGVGESMDLGVELPYLWLHPSPVTGQSEHGWSDVTFKFKHRFSESEKKEGGKDGLEQSFAYQVLYVQPSGREELGLGSGKGRWGARMISTTEYRDLEFNANLGYESSGRALRRGNFAYDNAISMSLAVKYDRSKPWEPVAELAVIRVKEPDALLRIITVLAGLIYEPSEKYYLDAGIRAGLNDTSEDYALLAGFGCKF